MALTGRRELLSRTSDVDPRLRLSVKGLLGFVSVEGIRLIRKLDLIVLYFSVACRRGRLFHE